MNATRAKAVVPVHRERRETTIDLSGKVVLLTGGTRGIGRAMAREFARAGASLAVSYQGEQDAAEAIATEFDALGVDHLVIHSDGSKSDAPVPRRGRIPRIDV